MFECRNKKPGQYWCGLDSQVRQVFFGFFPLPQSAFTADSLTVFVLPPCICAHVKHPKHWQLLGGSGGVVNSPDVCQASLKSLGCFYFRCVLSSQWRAVTVNLRILHCQLTFLEARSQNVSGNKQ